MTLPATFPKEIDISRFTTDIHLSDATANVDPSYFVTVGDTTVFRTKASERLEIGIRPIFPLESNTRYVVWFKVRKTAAGSLAFLRLTILAGYDAAGDGVGGFDSESYFPMTIASPNSKFGNDNAAIDPTDWPLNEWQMVKCYYDSATISANTFSRITLSLNFPLEGDDPISASTFEIESIEYRPQISLQDLHTEFGGPTPIKLSNYYRTPVKPPINAIITETATALKMAKITQSGIYPTLSDDLYNFTTDYNAIVPGNTLVDSPSIFSLVFDSGLSQNVVQTNGANGAPGWGMLPFFKLETGATYRLKQVKRILADGTNFPSGPGVSPQHDPYFYFTVSFFNSQRTYLGYVIYTTPALAANGWTTHTVDKSTSDWLASYPTAVYARVATIDNLYEYNIDGNYSALALNTTTQTSEFGVTETTGLYPLGSGSSLFTLYDRTGGNDDVWVRPSTTWQIASGRSISELGSPRQAVNPLNNIMTLLDEGHAVIDRSIRFNDVFTNWPRFNGDEYYANASVVPSGNEANGWSYIDGQIKSLNNSVRYIGFISPTEYDSYRHTVVLRSDSADDDTVGIVIAFKLVTGVPHSLMAIRANGGDIPNRNWAIIEVVGNATGSATTIVDGGFLNVYPETYWNNDPGGNMGGWAASGPTTVDITRNGNQITCVTSHFGNTALNPATTLSYTIPPGSPYEGNCAIGYATYSQAGTYFSDIAFAGPGQIPTAGQPIKLTDFYGTKRTAAPTFVGSANLGTYQVNDPIDVTLVANSADGFSLETTVSSLPPGLIFDQANSKITGYAYNYRTPTIEPAFIAMCNDGYYVTSQTFKFTYNNAAPTWVSPASGNLSTAPVGEVINIQMVGADINVAGGPSSSPIPDQPLRFTVVSGTIPPGLVFSTNGLLSGTTTGSPATYTFIISIDDYSTPVNIVNRVFNITVQ